MLDSMSCTLTRAFTFLFIYLFAFKAMRSCTHSWMDSFILFIYFLVTPHALMHGLPSSSVSFIYLFIRSLVHPPTGTFINPRPCFLFIYFPGVAGVRAGIWSSINPSIFYLFIYPAHRRIELPISLASTLSFIYLFILSPPLPFTHHVIRRFFIYLFIHSIGPANKRQMRMVMDYLFI